MTDDFVPVKSGETMQVTMSAKLSYTSGDEHQCSAMTAAHQDRHEPAFRFGWSEAIGLIRWTERGWYAANNIIGEQMTRIWFCPFCGEKLP